jgi:hypothetical protein
MSANLYMYKTVNGADGNIISIQRSDGASIPIDTKNSDYKEYLEWCDAGNTPESADMNIDYKTRRAVEYPPIGDQLDALFHAGLMPLEMAIKIQAVKAKYPKA